MQNNFVDFPSITNTFDCEYVKKYKFHEIDTLNTDTNLDSYVKYKMDDMYEISRHDWLERYSHKYVGGYNAGFNGYMMGDAPRNTK